MRSLFEELEIGVQALASIIKTKFEPAIAYATEGAALQKQLQRAVECNHSDLAQSVKHVVWTKTLQRMYFLAKQYVAFLCECAESAIQLVVRQHSVFVQHGLHANCGTLYMACTLPDDRLSDMKILRWATTQVCCCAGH
jgi:hypothetical protein